MADRETVDRYLALARRASWDPADAKQRVSAKLAARELATMGTRSPSGLDPSRARMKWALLKKLRIGALIGLSFAAGDWFGARRAVEARNSAALVQTQEGAASALPPLLAPGREPVTTRSNGVELPPLLLERAEDDSGALERREHGGEASRVAPRASGIARATVGRKSAGAGSAHSREQPMGDEVALLRRTDRAIRSGEGVLAMSLLDELDRRFPRSSLSEERGAARVLAACTSPGPEARRRARQFLQQLASSVYSERVRRSCGLDGEDAAPRTADGTGGAGH